MNMNGIVSVKGGVKYTGGCATNCQEKNTQKKKKGNSKMDRMSFVLDPERKNGPW